jgi:hypothetical protein
MAATPPPPADADRARTVRRRIAFVVVGLLLAVIFIGGYVFGLMRHL